MGPQEYREQIADILVELSDALLLEEDATKTLRRVAELAVRVIPGCTAAGVTIARGKYSTHAATDGLVHVIDSYQYEVGHGPCIDSIRRNQVDMIDDTGNDPTWPEFGAYASAARCLQRAVGSTQQRR